MARVMINCPTTNNPVSVGVDRDEQSFSNLPEHGNTLASCPECKHPHPWNRDDAFLEGASFDFKTETDQDIIP